MEDYDEFVRRRVSSLSRDEPGDRPPASPSVIRVLGHPILPPLVTGERRAEMLQHREEARTAAATAAARRKTKDAARPANVRAGMPQREQFCKAPPHEPEREEKSSLSHDSGGGSVLQRSPFAGANKHLLLSSPPEKKEKDESHLGATEHEHRLLGPLACAHDKDHNFDRHGGFSGDPDLSGALSSNHSLTAHLHTWQEPRENKSEQSVDLGGSLRPFPELLREGATRSSTEKNDEILLRVTESLLVPSPSESEESNGASVPLLEVTTHSAFHAAPQPENQEKRLINQHAGQRVSRPNCLRGLSHHSTLHDDLEITTGASRGSDAGTDGHMLGSAGGAYDVGSVFQHSSLNTIAKTPNIICYPPLDGDELERSGLESWLGYGFIISKGVSQSLVMPDSLVDGNCDPRLYSTESQDRPALPSVNNPSKGHDPEMLQSFGTHQPPTVHRHAEAAQSDKAKPQCINLQALLKRSQEYRLHQQMLRSKGKNREVQEKSQQPTRARTDDKKDDELLHKPKERKSALISGEETKEFWEKHKVAESHFLLNSTNSKSGNTHVGDDRRAEGIGQIQGEATADEANVSQEVAMKPKQSSSSSQQHHKGPRKYRMTRAATFSHSPVCWKGERTDNSRRREDPGLRNDVGGIGSKEQEVREATSGHRDGSAPGWCCASPETVDDISNQSAASSQHIDLIESSLCGLKLQILDLESMLKENLEDHSPNESDTHFNLDYLKDFGAFQSDCPDERDGPGHDGADSGTRRLRRQLLKEMVDTEENPGPELTDGCDEALLIGWKGPQPVGSGEPGLIKTVDTEEALAGEGVPHDAQIPEVSQNVSSGTEASSGFSVFSPTGSPEGENEAAGGCRYCSHPSDPWLLRASGSEFGSKGHLESPLSPEERDESSSGFSRIKGNLLTHTETGGGTLTCDDGRGWGPALGLSPGGKTWILLGQGCQKCGQKQSAAPRPEGDVGGGEPQEGVHTAGDGGQQEEPLQPGLPPPERFRPLLLAVAKGFLTRRLLKTERVKQLVDVVRDMQQLLSSLQQPNSLRKEIVTLKALLHLNAARSEISEIFFGTSAGARMQMISQDRELIQRRELGEKGVQTGRARRKSCLSAATQKSLERKRERLLAAIKSKAATQGQLKANCSRFREHLLP